MRLTTTPGGQLNVALANPASEVIKFIVGPGTCVGPTAVAYTIPKGKALIITAVDFYTQSQAQTPALVHFSFLTAAPAGSHPCTHILAGAAGADSLS